jgi:hypothetical protein
MAERGLYTAEQLAKIRATLEESLGDSSGGALENLDTRFTPKDESEEAGGGTREERKKEAEAKEKSEKDEESADVSIIIEEDKLKGMIAAIPDYKNNPDDMQLLASAILNHRDVKAFHLVEALGKINTDDVEMVEAFVEGITSRRGINPLIEALRFATVSPKAVKALAMGVAEQGTVNHLIRAIATAPQGQESAEIVWAMEIMGKGSMEQLLEAMKLLDNNSPGIVILATGLTNRKEVAIEPLVRALAASDGNHKACALLAASLTRLTDPAQLITLLEKYVTDDTEAAEILIAKLILSGNRLKDTAATLGKACGFMRAESMAGKMLAMGIIDQGNATQYEKSYNKMKGHPIGQKMIAIAIKNKVGGLKAMKLLGGVFFRAGKFEDEVRAANSEAKKRYKQVVEDVLKEKLK